MIKTLEERINFVRDKINKIKKRVHRRKWELKGGKLSSTRQKKFELNKVEPKKNLDVLINTKNELEEKLIHKNDELTITKEWIGDFTKYGEINLFDFHDIPQDI